MSSDPNHFTPASGLWRSRQSHNDLEAAMFHMSSPSYPTRTPLNGNGGTIDRWSGPLDFTGFPSEPHYPVRIIVYHRGIPREMSYRTTRFIGDSSPPPQPLPSMFTRQEEPRLSQEEQKMALKKLKKEIYNPTPKKLTMRLNLYYRDNAKYHSSEKAKEKEEEGKSCAICLEDFELSEVVMITPCNHMFHEDCIVPWVKSHGKCPVCRFRLCEQVRE